MEFPQGAALDMGDLPAIKQDPAAGGGQVAHHAVAHGGLAGAGFADDAQCFTLADGEGHIVYGLDCADLPFEQTLCHGEVHLQMFHREDLPCVQRA